MLWLLKQSWPVPFIQPYCWITILVAINVGVFAFQSPERFETKSLIVGACFLASLFHSLLVLAIGAKWRMQVIIGEPRKEPPRLPIRLAMAVEIVFVAVLPLLILVFPSCWALALAAWCLGAWFFIWSAFVAGMSITGDWI